MRIQRIELMPGVWLTMARTSKFKSSYWSLRLMTQMNSEFAAMNALIPFVLRRGTGLLSDMDAISAELSDLYGGAVEPSVYKCGDIQCLGFDASFLDDAFIPEGTCALEQIARLLGDFILHPATKNGRFRQDYVKSEKENLLHIIRSRENDKTNYARQRLVELMYRDENYAESRFGSEETAEKIQPFKLFNHYQDLLASAHIELFYCGSASEKRVEFAFLDALMDLPRNPEREEIYTDASRMTSLGATPVREYMQIKQGKLELGYQFGFGMSDPMYPAMVVCNALFGGFPGSRLFRTIREEQALCYQIQSTIVSGKGLLTVSCGTDEEHFNCVAEAVNRELEVLREGSFSAEEFASAKLSVIHQMYAVLDDQRLMSLEWQRAVSCGEPFDPERFLTQIEAVTEGDICAAATELIFSGSFELANQPEGGIA